MKIKSRRIIQTNDIYDDNEQHEGKTTASAFVSTIRSTATLLSI